LVAAAKLRLSWRLLPRSAAELRINLCAQEILNRRRPSVERSLWTACGVSWSRRDSMNAGTSTGAGARARRNVGKQPPRRPTDPSYHCEE
jgi:hypothetical protein